MPTFSFTVPGQPFSVNHYLKPVHVRRRDGSTMRVMAKNDGVETYQLIAANEARRAKPADFDPQGMLVIRYRWFVKRDIDCSNATKVIEDGIQAGLGINDKRFLPQSVYKQTGVKEPYTEVEVEYE